MTTTRWGAFVAAAALVVMAGLTLGAYDRIPDRAPFAYYGTFYRGGSDSIDAARVYFAASGTTTVAESLSVGALNEFAAFNMGGAADSVIEFRAYHPGGVTNAGTDSAYTLITLAKYDDNYTADEFRMPEGMRINSIQVVRNGKSAATSMWRWAK
jgi:hypothetical protein